MKKHLNSIKSIHLKSQLCTIYFFPINGFKDICITQKKQIIF